jgi:hypothetical protein
MIAVIAGVFYIGLQLLGSVKSAQSKEYKKLQAQMRGQDIAGGGSPRKVSFDSQDSSDLDVNFDGNESALEL